MRCNNLISCCDITTKFTDTKTQLHLLHSSSFKRYNWAPACGLINSLMDLFILFIITETNSPLVSQLLRQRHDGGPSGSAAGGTWTVCAERRSASHRRSVSGRSQSHTAGCTHTHTLTHRLWNCLCGNSNRKRKLPPPPKKKRPSEGAFKWPCRRGAWPGRGAGGAQVRAGVMFRQQQQVEERIFKELSLKMSWSHADWRQIVL